ncbi:MAG: double-strand break repair helicase AddA [Azospirillum sp.]|nr:double-strand break repair helicase AddA [Azospirillum sp.]
MEGIPSVSADSLVSARGPDPDVAQRRASDPAASVWVGASAGTGKTKVLTDRVLRLMLAGTPPQRILCLTFTKAAAAEMSLRINRTLGQWATIADDRLDLALFDLTGERPAPEHRHAARRLFARVIDCPGGMRIQTIHAFCQSLLRRFPLEAGCGPHFEVMDERSAAELLAEALHEVLDQARRAPTAPLGRALARLTAELGEDAFAGLLAEVTAERGQLQTILDRHGGLEGTVAAVYRFLKVVDGADETTVVATACDDRNFDQAGLRGACRALAAGSPTDQERGIGLQAWLDAAPEGRQAGFGSYQGHFLTKEELPRKTLMTKKPAAANPAALAALEAEAARLVAVLQQFKAAAVASATAALIGFGAALLDSYGRHKAARALLDYDDLILAVRDLLTRRGVAPWVLFKLDGGLDHILIDEAQDTNPEQWQVIAALAEEFFAGLGAREVRRTVFAVGDEKQSIFSFQRAAPAEFARMRRHFAARVAAARDNAANGWRQIDLDISFRSTAAVLRTVDAVFAQEPARDGVAFDPAQVIRHRAHRRGHGGLVELWPPVVPQERPEPAPWEPPLALDRLESPPARLAAVIADTIRGWLDRGEMLPARGRAVQPGDIMVLVRRRTSFVADLVRALKDRGVAVAGVDRMVLTDQLSVMDLLALAQFLLLPEDDLTLATVLKGPMVGLDEEALFTLAHGRSGSLWAALAAHRTDQPCFRAARSWLEGLLAATDFTPPFDLFSSLLSSPCPADPVSGQRALFARLGAEARDPIDEFLAVSLVYQRSHPPALQGFLAWLGAAPAEIKRDLEPGGGPAGGAVRVMTVHGAKGLQAPIVFLPDTMAVPAQSPRILWPDGDRPVPLFAPRRGLEEGHCAEARAARDHRRDQEYRRLLYVALTRAEDRLYIGGWQGGRPPSDACWYRLVESALAQAGEPAEFDFAAVSRSGWSGPGRRLVEAQTAPPRSDDAGTRRDGAELPLPPWATAAAPEEPAPPRPLTPSRPEDVEPAVRSPLGGDDGARFRRGLLIHRLLQTLPELAPDRRSTACRRFLAEPVHGLDDGEQAEIAAETLGVLDHPEFRPLFGPGSRAEVPIVGLVAGRVLSGQIDRLMVEPTTVWVIDFKTNRPPPRDPALVPALYLRQMAIYRAALREIYPGREVRCVLLWTDGPFLMELSAAALEGALPG